MSSEELEFSISQYIDGTLSPAERVALERILAENAQAKALLDEYRRLDVVLKAPQIPNLNFEFLATSISSAIDDAEEEQASRYRMPAWIRSAALPLTLAASILIVAGVGLRGYFSHSHHGTNPSSAGTELAIEIGPPSPAPVGPSQEDVSIGPGPDIKGQPL